MLWQSWKNLHICCVYIYNTYKDVIGCVIWIKVEVELAASYYSYPLTDSCSYRDQNY